MEAVVDGAHLTFDVPREVVSVGLLHMSTLPYVDTFLKSKIVVDDTYGKSKVLQIAESRLLCAWVVDSIYVFYNESI